MKKVFIYSTFAAVVIAMSGCSQAEKSNTEPVKAKSQQIENVISADGAYVGLADNHTVEIKLPDGAKAFQFPESMKNKFDGLAEGSKVSIKYVKNELKEFTVTEAVAEQELSGTYVGLADPHTIEIKTADGAKAFQITEDFRSRFENVPEGTKITVQYEKNTIKDFQLEEKLFEETGVYVGQADPHTVEIETANGAQSYQLSDAAKEQIKQLKKDDSVNFQYVKSDNGQLILKSIDKK